MSKNKIIIFPVLFFYCIWIHASKSEIDSLLKELDKVIVNAPTYTNQKLDKLNNLKHELSRSKTLNDMYNINYEIFESYSGFISDSALCYLNKNLEVALKIGDKKKINETSRRLSILLSSLGMYSEAEDVLDEYPDHYPDAELQSLYYLAKFRSYKGLSIYTQDTRSRKKYYGKADIYRDSLLRSLNQDSEEFLKNQENHFRELRKLDLALEINDRRLKKANPGTPVYAMATFSRSLIYMHKGDAYNQKKYAILSSIADIQLSIKDNASLTVLSQILFKEGDLNRAYKYIKLALDNINVYNTRLRSSDILNIQTIIDKAYQQKSEEQNKKIRTSLIIISILTILLIFVLFFLYQQIRKVLKTNTYVKTANQELQEMTGKLKSLNQELEQTNLDVLEANSIKEEYLGHFLNQCLTYIDKLDEFRKMVNKKLSNGQQEELYRQTKKTSLKEEELKEFFTNFDNMFLKLFPNFIEEFNQLLIEGEEITVKKGEPLKTELRIYALIRLGINDSSSIASFLGYSVNTIYNYRAKIKSKTKVQREDFEWKVKRIGTFNK